jgi:hypothetical protein
MRKILLFGLAAIMMAACSNDDSLSSIDQKQISEGSRYMAISLATNVSNTRAEDESAAEGENTATESSDVFADGESYEYAVAGKENVVFYFFDASGYAYAVNENKDNYLVPASFSSVESKDVTDDASVTSSEELTWSTSDDANVTSISNLILVFEKKQGTAPAQVVALVNAEPAENGTYPNYATLDALKAVVEDAANAQLTKDKKTYFLMSNSVYKDESGEIVDATPIETENIATSIAEAAKHPVQIYVERVNAKVTFQGATDNKDVEILDGVTYYKVASANVEDNLDTYAGLSIKDDDIYVAVEGWTIFNKTDKYNLIKNLSAPSNASVWTWNDSGNFRSYWANTTTDASIVGDKVSYKNITDAGENAHIEYALENTINADNLSSFTKVTGTAAADYNTSVILATKLYRKVTGDDNSVKFKPLELTKWLSRYYTVANLKKAIVSYLGKTLWYAEIVTEGEGDAAVTTTKYTTIGEDDIDFEVSAPTYTVKVVLSESGAKKDWSSKGNSDAANKLDAVAVNEKLAKVPSAQIWTGGDCYYFAPIKHLDNSNSIVRNHWYQVQVTSITGLGTAVYDSDEVVDPVNPSDNDDQQWYLDAKINILSWKLVSNQIGFVTNK